MPFRKDMYVLFSRTRQHVTLQRKLDLKGVIKLRIMRLRDCTGLSRSASDDLKGPLKRLARESKSENMSQ